MINIKSLIKIRPLFKNYVYTIQRGLAKGLKRKGGMSFIPQLAKPSKEDLFLSGLDLKDNIIFDIGAFEGVFTLFFARAVGDRGQVYTFEPNPINYNLVLENVALNGFEQVKVINTALGDTNGKLNLVFRSFEAGSGSLNTTIQSKFFHTDKLQTVEVSLDTLDHQIAAHNLPTPDFVKLDVEGFEPQIIQGMQELLKRAKPTLFIELHGFMLDTEKDTYWSGIVEPLLDLGYSIKHIETDRKITKNLSNPPLDGHIYCWISQENHNCKNIL
ncbi:MAG: FkbM family methyltransferase [Gomphosphaeria aponina SAG 52.96 = DSM 107014]|uniref:FkbM family methyltransferase n=1 Tax=Gomphosphaeria aponina SAG 52.96 = DSM 107014 TaxID=1521640 RepID=A0A941GWK8_9CHRO|nr:FkbM family methyltransferase [Gomphosphaeria aponina SAG 52.96 = DSM 107014]